MEREQSQTKRNEKEHENDLRSVSMFFVVLHRTQTISEQVVVEVLRESRALLRVDLKVVYPCFTRNTGSEITSNTRKRFLFTNTKSNYFSCTTNAFSDMYADARITTLTEKCAVVKITRKGNHATSLDEDSERENEPC